MVGGLGLQDMVVIGCGVQYGFRVFLVCATGWIVMLPPRWESRESRGVGHGDFEGPGGIWMEMAQKLLDTWAPSFGE